MDFINTFLGLALLAGYNALFLYPAAVLLSLAIISWSLSWKNWRASEHRGSLLLLLVPSIGTVLILLFGTVFHCGNLRPCADTKLTSASVILSNAFATLELPLVAWMVLRLQKLRSVALILGALQLWYAALAAVMAQMSVSGTWL